MTFTETTSSFAPQLICIYLHTLSWLDMLIILSFYFFTYHLFLIMDIQCQLHLNLKFNSCNYQNHTPRLSEMNNNSNNINYNNNNNIKNNYNIGFNITTVLAQ